MRKGKQKPVIGDFKRRVRFAFLPIRIEGKWVLWDKYIKVWRFETFHYEVDHPVSSGLIEDVLTASLLVNERYYTTRESKDMWRFHSRELFIDKQESL